MLKYPVYKLMRKLKKLSIKIKKNYPQTIPSSSSSKLSMIIPHIKGDKKYPIYIMIIF